MSADRPSTEPAIEFEGPYQGQAGPYFGDYGGYVQAISASDGKLLWKLSLIHI